MHFLFFQTQSHAGSNLRRVASTLLVSASKSCMNSLWLLKLCSSKHYYKATQFVKEHCWVRKNIFYLLSKVSFLKNTFGIWSMVNSSLATTSSIIVYPKSKSNMFEASIAETTNRSLCQKVICACCGGKLPTWTQAVRQALKLKKDKII